MSRQARSWPALLLDALVPGRCLGCRAHGDELCSTCRTQLQECSAVPGAIYDDDGPAAQIVRCGKHGRSWRAAAVMAELTIERWRDGRAVRPVCELVTWVPHDTVRGARRGMHLPELYARALARSLGAPAVSLLQRRTGAPQRGSSREARQLNVRDAFLPAARPPAQLRGSILLIDDVVTTGATLEAAGNVLELAGSDATAVRSLAFTRVVRHTPHRATTRHGRAGAAIAVHRPS